MLFCVFPCSPRFPWLMIEGGNHRTPGKNTEKHGTKEKRFESSVAYNKKKRLFRQSHLLDYNLFYSLPNERPLGYEIFVLDRRKSSEIGLYAIGAAPPNWPCIVEI